MPVQMRKCSRSVHSSLSELNITPLLDLGFVLLVIFIITTAPTSSDRSLSLPASTPHPKEAPSKANYITVETNGTVYLNRKQVTYEGLLAELIQMRAADPDLSVIVRGDGKSKYRGIVQVLAALQKANVTKVDLATEPKTSQAN